MSQAAAAAKTSPDFVISRVFNAPREMLWKCFTEPEHVPKWWGPKGVTSSVKTLDLRPGGMCHYKMITPDGQVWWGKSVYREIAASSRLVFINSFSDEDAGLTRHPLGPTWPLEMMTIITFEEQPGGKSKVTIRWTPHNPTAEERQTFDAGHDSMRMGWTGSLDQLEAYLANGR